MSNLQLLSDYAKSIGAHAQLKPQPKGNYTLFVCKDEAPNNSGTGATYWHHIITIDEIDNKYKIRFPSSKTSDLLTIEKAKETINNWFIDTNYEI